MVSSFTLQTKAASLCARFAFKPSQLAYCGGKGSAGAALSCIVSGRCTAFSKSVKTYKALYSYLKVISTKHKKDLLDKDVVEAYWIGNDLCENYSISDFKKFLKELKNFSVPKPFLTDLKKKFTEKNITFIPHHSFNVLFVGVGNVTGNVKFNLENINNCLVRSGEVIEVQSSKFKVKSWKLESGNLKRFRMVDTIEEIYFNQRLTPVTKIGTRVMFHWGESSYICSKKEDEALKEYTNLVVEEIKKL